MTIKQAIGLEGAEAFRDALRSLGEAGVAAFKQFQDAVAKVNTKKLEDDLGKIGKHAADVRDSFGKLGDDIGAVGRNFLIIGGSISAAAVGFTAWIKSGAQAEISIQNLARQAGTSATEMQAMIGAMTESGQSADNLEVAFKRLAVRVATDWPQIKKSIRDAADSVIKDQLGMESAARDLERAQIALRQIIATENPTLVTPSVNVQADKDRLALLSKADALAKVEEAQLKVNEATKKAADDAAASAPVLKAYVENLAKGFDTAASDITKSVDNIFKGIVIAAASGTEELKGKGLASILNVPELDKVVILLSDVMKNMRSETDKTALAVLAFGRGVGESMVHFLSKGSEEIKRMMGELKALGLTKFDPNIARGFEESFALLGLHIDLIFRQIKDLFIPGLTVAFQSIDELITSNKDKLLDMARAIANNVLSVLRDLILLMSGKSELVQNQWIIEWRDGILNLKDNVIGFKETLKKEFGEVMNVLDSIAAKITDITGKKITGEQLGIALLVGQFTGLNNVILDVIKTIGVLLIALVGIGLLIPTTLVAAIPAVIAAIGSFIGAIAVLLAGDYLQEPFNKFMNWLVDEFFPSLGPAIVNAWNSAIDSFFAAIDAAIQFIKDKWNALKQFLANPLNIGRVEGQGNFAPNVGGAQGGLITGPGTTTSDSILAWLSNREFVINAKAVSHYGPDFFAALNSMRLPRDMFGGFKMGGLVDALARSMPIPRFAAGGMAAAGTPITLNIGGQSFGMTASEDTVRKLRSYAVQNQLSSTGRKPRWVR